MGRVADSAAQAFRISGTIIFFAIVLLALSALSQRFALSVLHRLSNWVLLIYNVRISESAGGGGSVDFSGAISAFREVITSFDGMSNDLVAIGSFRADLIQSSNSIRDAVAKLPTQIQGNMDRLSTGAFREIADHLEKHYSVLCKILAIYGDQEMRVKEIQTFVKELGQQNAEAGHIKHC